MSRTYAALLIFGAVLAGSDRALAECDDRLPQQGVYTLYRGLGASR